LPRQLIRCLLPAALCLLLPACGRDESPRGSDVAQAPGAPGVQDPRSEAERGRDLRRRVAESAPEPGAWEPDIAVDGDQDVDALLERAQTALSAGHLLAREDGALALYLSALERQPENDTARAGLDAVSAELRSRVADALRDGRTDEAAELVPALLRLQPADAEVLALKQRLDGQQEQRLLLREAERLIELGRLVEPAGENAAEVFREILRDEPDNREAIAGLSRLEQALIARASAAAEAGNYAESDRLLAEAGRLRPGSQSVQNASTRIVELRQDRAQALAAAATRAIDARDLDRAESLLRELEAVSALADGVDALRIRLANARLYGGRSPGEVFNDRLADGGEGPAMVVLPAGAFRMGSPGDEVDRKPNEGPLRRVEFARGFALSRYEISIGEFARFVQATSYVSTAERNRRSTVYDERSGSMAERRGVSWRDDYAGGRGRDELPVVHVSLQDAEAFAAWLAQQTGQAYRLPSEAEMEYAIRAGSESRYPWGDGNPTRILANLTGDGERSASRRSWANAFPRYNDGHWGPAPVGSFEPNAFGLHDINGNVSAWTADCWHDTYARGPVDGSAWVNPGCPRYVIRGASWASAPDQVRSAFRLTAAPTASNARVGIRLARDL
jgi:formylglycine-generating enzyme required for sulfatase activity